MAASTLDALFHGTNHLAVTVASGDALDVRSFAVEQRMSSIFTVSLEVMSDNPSLEFDAILGKAARFAMRTTLHNAEPTRFWSGICNHLQQVRVQDRGLSTYRLTIVPPLWFTTQRRNYKIFQQLSEPDIVLSILAEWGIAPTVKLSGDYKKRKYRVQYAESDHAFMRRMLEDVGISFYFEQGSEETALVLSDAPQANDARAPILFSDEPEKGRGEYVTRVSIGKKVRPGKYTLRDHDYRRPATYPLLASAETKEASVEQKLERYHYAPGAFLFASDKGDDTPHADDKGMVRADDAEGKALAQKRLDAKRGNARTAAFETNAYDLAPGIVTSMLDYSHADLGAGKRLLVVASTLRGTSDGEWHVQCEARSADSAYRPAVSTKKPKIPGVESATVVGPAGEEIHTDEFGRVRVQFHWDRYGQRDDDSSCWIHVSQPWGGSAYGGVNLPRIGQEVLVDFLGGDPDRPIITGRVYTNLQKVPYGLPGNKTQSGWKSNSSPTTGGYNEIMFEDKADNELVRMQAEKDLHKLVKNDEQVKIGNDRTKEVGRDDSHTVGNDRKHQVGNDENIKVGNDQSKSVGNDESTSVGNNRSKSVGGNEDSSIGGNRSKSVGGNEDSTIANDLSKLVGGSEREVTSGNKRSVVGSNRSTEVGGIDATTVGDTHSVMISPAGEMADGGGNASHVMWDQAILSSTLGTAIKHTQDTVTIDADHIKIHGRKSIEIICDGGTIIIKGGPKVKINPSAADMANEQLKNMNPGTRPDSTKMAKDHSAAAEKYRATAEKLGQKHNVPPALLLGLVSRESHFGLGKTLDANGFGTSDPNGYGYFQVDKVAHPHPELIGKPDSYEHGDQAVGIFQDTLDGVRADHPDWTPDEQLAGAVLGYNAGNTNVTTRPSSADGWEQLDNNKKSDKKYSRDVWARALWFADNLTWTPHASRKDDLSTGKDDHCGCQPVKAADGSPDVYFNDKPALRQQDPFKEHGNCEKKHKVHAGKVKKGSATVTIDDGLQAARIGDPVDCPGGGNKVAKGSDDVFIGD